MKIWRPYTQEGNAMPALEVAQARGAHLDLADGRRIFDGISSWWLVTHGHGTAEIQQAVATQSRKFAQTVFANFTHEPARELCSELERVLPVSLTRCYFSDNGSTAVEVALKMAYQFCAQTGKGRRRKILAFERSYHGDTCGAMSVSQRGAFTENYSGMLFEIVRCKQGLSINDPLASWVDDFDRQMQVHGEDICAVIVEPLLQGAGGMIVWPKAAVRRICEEAKRRGILVIFDEVMTGFGRTGSLFAFEQIGCTPDLLCLSKGLTGGVLPMGLTVVSDQVFQGFYAEEPDKMLFHGHSFTGNALSCAAAVANLKLWRQNDVRVRLGEIERAQVTALERAPAGLAIRERRSCGTVGIVDFDLPGDYGGWFSRRVYKDCLNGGVFIRTLGSTVYLMPPYCATPGEIQEAWAVIFAVIENLPSQHSRG